MKKNLFLLSAAIFLISSLVYATIAGGFENIGTVAQFSYLGTDSGTGINLPLELRKGEQVILRGQFTSTAPANQFNVKCSFNIKDASIPIPAELDGLNMPIVGGYDYNCFILFTIPKSMPSIPCQLKIALEDETGRIYVGALINCKIY